MDFPVVKRQHISETARLYADRQHMISELRCGERGVIAEVGVALGEFSDFLLDTLQPVQLVALDIFTLHEVPVINAHGAQMHDMRVPTAWGQQSTALLRGMSHLDFYKERMARRGDQVTIEVGLSEKTLARYPDESFDMIYIDASHDYDSVWKDAELAARKLRTHGTLIFNDYIIYDHITGSPYGVVQAANRLIVGGNWRVIGLALQQQVFCDIAIRRSGPDVDFGERLMGPTEARFASRG